MPWTWGIVRGAPSLLSEASLPNHFHDSCNSLNLADVMGCGELANPKYTWDCPVR